MQDSGMSAVALAAIGLVSAILLVVVKPLFTLIREQDKTHKKLSDSIDKNTTATITNTKSNQEVLTFMQNLNGKLAKATIQTVREQNVEHQHITTAVVNEEKK